MNPRTYRAIWRWHFHAGLFCIPFVVLLAITGSIYLFKPQIEAFADRDVDRLMLSAAAAAPSAQVAAAQAALPGAKFAAYELPREPDDAVRVHLRAADGARHVIYVHPQTLEVLKTVQREQRFTEIVKNIHGELLIGRTGSILVELAASWAIVMLITGVFLWWPRNAQGLAGVLYPRVGAGQRVFWRDLHAVTGFWIAGLAMFLLLTGLPWTTVWGGAFKEIRDLASSDVVRQDWAQGRGGERAAERVMFDEHAGHEAGAPSGPAPSAASLDSVVSIAVALRIAPPVMVQPPSGKSGEAAWSIRGESQNRPLRREVSVSARTGDLLRDQSFAERPLVDRVIGIGIAAHEGQLFGLANQLLGVLTAFGLVALCVSAVVLWWRRRPEGSFAVPAPKVAGFRIERSLAFLIVALAVLLPVFGLSLLLVAAVDRLLQGPPAPAS